MSLKQVGCMAKFSLGMQIFLIYIAPACYTCIIIICVKNTLIFIAVNSNCCTIIILIIIM